MTREEVVNSMSLQDAIQVLKDTNCYGTMDIAKTVILKALEQEPCDDAISRQAVLDLPRIKTHNHWGNVIKESVDVEDVRQLPPVNPAEKVGEWLCIGNKFVEWGVCSLCKENSYEPFAYAKMHFKYCPQCGAKMQEVKECQ